VVVLDVVTVELLVVELPGAVVGVADVVDVVVLTANVVDVVVGDDDGAYVTTSLGRLAGVPSSLLANRRRLFFAVSTSWLMRRRSQPPPLTRASSQSVARFGNVKNPGPAGGV
jgi:hypothetical protein